MPGHPRRVALLGLMAAGKSTVGAEVARLLAVPFVDTDDELLHRTGSTVKELWAQGGEAAYRPVESLVTLDALARPAAVVGVPAGAVMDPEVVAALADGTRLVIWLDAPADVLADRTAGQDHRPLLGDDPGSVLARQRAERAERYAALADLTLDATRSPADLAAEIAARSTGT